MRVIKSRSFPIAIGELKMRGKEVRKPITSQPARGTEKDRVLVISAVACVKRV